MQRPWRQAKCIHATCTYICGLMSDALMQCFLIYILALFTNKISILFFTNLLLLPFPPFSPLFRRFVRRFYNSIIWTNCCIHFTFSPFSQQNKFLFFIVIVRFFCWSGVELVSPFLTFPISVGKWNEKEGNLFTAAVIPVPRFSKIADVQQICSHILSL